MSVDALKRSPVFARLPAAGLEAVSHYFAPRHIPAQAPVWYEEQTADEMAVVVGGALTVKMGVQEIGSVGAGELVGETSTFFGENRVATVFASEPTDLLVIAREALVDLRSGHPEIYDRLLDRALAAMARRVRETGTRIAMIGNGGMPLPERKPPPSLRSLLRIMDREDAGPPAPILPVLRGLPILKNAAPDVLNRVASALTPRRIRANEAIFLEADPGDSVFILVEGTVDVIRNVRGGKARRLSLLQAGSVFGTGSLLLGERRNASCVAASDGWVREMSRATHDQLTGEPGRAWRESLLAALRFQVQEAGNNLANLKGGTTWAEKQKLRLAAQRLMAFKAATEDPFTFKGRGAP